MANNRLASNTKLLVNQTLVPANNKAHLILQSDGNVVLYRNDDNAVLWTTWTNGKSVQDLIMQSDGNLVCYDATGAAVWASGTDGNPGASLLLQEDGNLVIFDANGVPLWSTNSSQWDFTPSTIAARAILTKTLQAPIPWTYNAMPSAVGWAYKLRRDGASSADAPFGWARTPSASSAGMAMSNDTIIHVASMSKPVCITAFVALIEDWQALADGVRGTGPLAAPRTMVLQTVVPVPLPLPLPPPPNVLGPPQPIQVPAWLAPALSDRALATQLLGAGLGRVVPPSLQGAVDQFASGRAVIEPAVAAPPAYATLLGHVLAGAAVPKYTDAFLPLIKPRLQQKAASLGIAYVEGSNVASVTLDQIITHNSSLRNGMDPSLLTLIPSAKVVQPADGSHATCDVWSYLLAYVRQDADAATGYKNDDYNVLGGVVEQCAGMAYDDFVYARLFSDPRFSALRRYVTNAAQSALYYGSPARDWPSKNAFPTHEAFPGGNPFPDYRGFGGSGGFYYTANQITDWLYALYSGASVERAACTGGSAPLLSTSSLSGTLFGTTAYFAASQKHTNSAGWTTYTHNGGTSVGGGSCSGNLGVAVSPTGSVITAFICANGDIDANGAFDAALADVIKYG